MTTSDIKEAHIHDKIAELDAQAIVGMLMRWYLRQAKRNGITLAAIDARDAAIQAVFGCQPVGGK
jgi:hypothetical protein